MRASFVRGRFPLLLLSFAAACSSAWSAEPTASINGLFRIVKTDGSTVLGQAVKAFVTLAPGAQLTARDIVRHCQQRLEGHMVPKEVEFVAELPTTESGKVRHATLREAAKHDAAPRPDAPAAVADQIQGSDSTT